MDLRQPRPGLLRRVPAGVLVGLAMSIKLTPGVFVVHYLVNRRWREAALGRRLGRRGHARHVRAAARGVVRVLGRRAAGPQPARSQRRHVQPVAARVPAAGRARPAPPARRCGWPAWSSWASSGFADRPARLPQRRLGQRGRRRRADGGAALAGGVDPPPALDGRGGPRRARRRPAARPAAAVGGGGRAGLVPLPRALVGHHLGQQRLAADGRRPVPAELRHRSARCWPSACSAGPWRRTAGSDAPGGGPATTADLVDHRRRDQRRCRGPSRRHADRRLVSSGGQRTRATP